jgi:hypothetical protein
MQKSQDHYKFWKLVSLLPRTPKNQQSSQVKELQKNCQTTIEGHN